MISYSYEYDVQPWQKPGWTSSIKEYSFSQAIEHIEASLRYGIDPSLDAVNVMLEVLNHPELSYRTIQIAGTNGKTSTSHYTAALLQACGFRTGLYTSPHLVSYTERVEIDGVVVSEEAFAHAVSLALATWDEICSCSKEFAAEGCTEFELLTVAAFCLYAEAGVDVVVLEAGLGGRWDATSAARPGVVCITGIGLDHMKILGDTLALIAKEKAAIIKDGRDCILGPNALLDKEVAQVMYDTCENELITPVLVCEQNQEPAVFERETYPQIFFSYKPFEDNHNKLLLTIDGTFWCQNSTKYFPVELDYKNLTCFAPTYQPQNIACAIAVATAFLGRRIPTDIVGDTILHYQVPGRFQVIRTDPLLIVDACHNPQSAQACAQMVQSYWPKKEDRPALLLGVLADKDHAGIIQELVPLFDTVYVTQSSSSRSFNVTQLVNEIERITNRMPDAVFSDASKAVFALRDTSVLCCGTITLIGEVIGIEHSLA
ncbi:MAG: bifunctional folylpolyglutamate synthase/dihydrofolate synthase [Coriobacteriales bacterium]|nr:bifunctional folylpolyglutamate synthase/dihydrofolate synthase [Coriobacteriales bacterium]